MLHYQKREHLKLNIKALGSLYEISVNYSLYMHVGL